LHGAAVRVLELFDDLVVAAAGHVGVAPEHWLLPRRQDSLPALIVVEDHLLVALVQIIVHGVPLAAGLVLELVRGCLELLLDVEGVDGGADDVGAADVVDGALDVVLRLLVVVRDVVGEELALVLRVLVRDVLVDHRVQY